MGDKKLFCTGCTGTVVAAVCCFTPVLGVSLGAVGLSAWLGWADYVLFPALAVFLGLTIHASGRMRRKRLGREGISCAAAKGVSDERADGTAKRGGSSRPGQRRRFAD